jgi:hypothetical protein
MTENTFRLTILIALVALVVLGGLALDLLTSATTTDGRGVQCNIRQAKKTDVICPYKGGDVPLSSAPLPRRRSL